MEEIKNKKPRKVRDQALSADQEKFCLKVVQGENPLEAMLSIYTGRRAYAKSNQTRLLNSMMKNPRIVKRLSELYQELRNNEVLADMYDFDKGVKLLLYQIRLAKEKIQEVGINEPMHRVIFTSIQELNRMYGFNIIDRDGNKQGSMNVTFVNVNEVKPNMLENNNEK